MKPTFLAGLAGLVLFILATPAVHATDINVMSLEAQIKDATQSQRVMISQSIGKIDSRLISTGKYNVDIDKEIQRHIASASREYQLPVSLLNSIIAAESGFNPTAISKKKCYGLTQLAPATANELGADIYDLRQNIHGGAFYFRQMYNLYGSVEEALWAYNAGPARVADNVLPQETVKYVQKVMRLWQEFERGPRNMFSMPGKSY